MLPVLLLFLLPIGGGIPAGVLLAQARGFHWPLTAGLYLASDVILALVFEPVLLLLVARARRVPALARFAGAMKVALARSVAPYSGRGTGPFAHIMISFGLDPMTGRAAALAAGHGFLPGWTFAITGDLLYYALIALATLGLNTWIRNPNLTVLAVMAGMIGVPMLVRRLRVKRARVVP